ncbi:MAG: hypothetical protein GYA14_11490 [Ignavibacteria bacterium]|nr:hypothetical protein [Ignavibacteria bacterium]
MALTIYESYKYSYSDLTTSIIDKLKLAELWINYQKLNYIVYDTKKQTYPGYMMRGTKLKSRVTG